MEKEKYLEEQHSKRVKLRANWDTLWQALAYFFLPDKDDVYQFQNGVTGDNKFGRLYDTFGVYCNETLATMLQGMLISPSDVWMEFHHPVKEIDNLPHVRRWFRDLDELMISLMNNSNFQPQAHEFFLNLTGFGTAIMGVFEDEDKLVRYQSDPTYKWYCEENDKGIVDTMSCIDKITIKQAIERYGEEGFGEHIEEAKKKLDEKIEILITIMPRHESELTEMGDKSKPFTSIHLWRDKKHKLREKGFNEFPYAVTRFYKVADEVNGRCPAMKALPDVQMLNQMMKTIIRAAQKVVDPPMNVPDDSFLGGLSLVPGALNPYRSGTEDRIYPIQTSADIGLGLDIVEHVKEQIKRHFYIDQFQLRDGPQMTATEVNAILDQQLRLLGPLMVRAVPEFLRPIATRNLGIMARKGELPPNPPQELMDGGELKLEVNFVSKIAKAQRSSDADTLVAFLLELQGIAEQEPRAKELINVDRTVRNLSHMRGVSEDIFNTADELEEIEEARAKAEQEALETNRQLAGAEILNKGVGPAKELGVLNESSQAGLA